MWFPSVRTLRLLEPSSSAASSLLPSNESRAGHILSLPATASLPLSSPPQSICIQKQVWAGTSWVQVPGCPCFRSPTRHPGHLQIRTEGAHPHQGSHLAQLGPSA